MGLVSSFYLSTNISKSKNRNDSDWAGNETMPHNAIALERMFLNVWTKFGKTVCCRCRRRSRHRRRRSRCVLSLVDVFVFHNFKYRLLLNSHTAHLHTHIHTHSQRVCTCTQHHIAFWLNNFYSSVAKAKNTQAIYKRTNSSTLSFSPSPCSIHTGICAISFTVHTFALATSKYVHTNT